MIKKMINLSFKEENGKIYFSPYGAMGNKIEITQEQKNELFSFLYKDYVFTLILLLFATLFGSFIPLFLTFVSLFVYHRKVKKIGTVKFSSKKQFKKKLESEVNDLSVFFDLLAFVCGLTMLLASVFLLYMKPDAFIIAIIGILFSGFGVVFFIYLFILRYKKKKKDGR